MGLFIAPAQCGGGIFLGGETTRLINFPTRQTPFNNKQGCHHHINIVYFRARLRLQTVPHGVHHYAAAHIGLSNAVAGGIRTTGTETIVDGDLANLQAGGVFHHELTDLFLALVLQMNIADFSSVSLAFIFKWSRNITTSS